MLLGGIRKKLKVHRSLSNKFPQFTTMNVIDGQAVRDIYSSLIFYSLTIDNILNIIVLLILAGISIAMLTGENGILAQADKANQRNDIAETREQIVLELMGRYDDYGSYTNDDVIEAVKTVTGQEVEEGTEIITTAKGNEVDISDLWGKIYNYQINIDGLKFLTLGEAVENSSSGDSIYFLRDCVETSVVEVDRNLFFETRSVAVSGSMQVRVHKGAKLTLYGSGSIESSAMNAMVVSGILEVNGDCRIVGTENGGLWIEEGGEATINGGEVVGPSGVFVRGANCTRGLKTTLTVNGGKIVGCKYDAINVYMQSEYCGAKVEVFDGYLYGETARFDLGQDGFRL